MPLVTPLPADHDPKLAERSRFFEGTLGFDPHSVLTMMRRPALARALTAELEAPTAADGERWLAEQGWTRGQHGGTA